MFSDICNWTRPVETLLAVAICLVSAGCPGYEEPAVWSRSVEPPIGEFKLTMLGQAGAELGPESGTEGRLHLFEATLTDRPEETGRQVVDLGEPPLAWGFTTIDAAAAGIPLCEDSPAPDSEDPAWPGVVLLRAMPDDVHLTLLISTSSNRRDGVLSSDGCGVGLEIEEWDGQRGHGAWRGWGIVETEGGTFRMERLDARAGRD